MCRYMLPFAWNVLPQVPMWFLPSTPLCGALIKKALPADRLKPRSPLHSLLSSPAFPPQLSPPFQTGQVSLVCFSLICLNEGTSDQLVPCCIPRICNGTHHTGQNKQQQKKNNKAAAEPPRPTFCFTRRTLRSPSLGARGRGTPHNPAPLWAGRCFGAKNNNKNNVNESMLRELHLT